MSVVTLLLALPTVGGIYGLIKIIHDMIKGRKFKEIINRHEFYILIVSVILTIIILFPWGKIHFGELPTKTVYVPVRQKTNPIETKDTASNKSSVQGIQNFKRKHFTPQKDTLKTTAIPPNGILSTGANAHNVAGTGNRVEVNGDVYNSLKARILDDAMYFNLMKRVEKFWDEHPKAERNRITVSPSEDKDSRQLAIQLVNRLKLNKMNVNLENSLQSQVQSDDDENFIVMPYVNNKDVFVIVMGQPNVK